MIYRMSAVYENGVLKPDIHVPVPDGGRVELVVITPSFPVDINSPEQIERRRQSIERLRKLDAEADAEPDDGYDLVAEINKERIRCGARPIIPPDEATP